MLGLEQVLERVGGFAAARHVVLTGGEPMVAAELPELARRLRDAGYHITIETAGTIPPGGIACDLASISPKLSHSTPSVERAGLAWVERHERVRRQPAVLRQWLAGYRVQWKFVIAQEGDLAEAEELLAEVSPDIAGCQIMLMPEGVDAETLRRRVPQLIEVCKERGYRLTPRAHIDWFGNKRGT